MKAVPRFSFARPPRLEFGQGAAASIPDLVSGYGNVAVVAGSASFRSSGRGAALLERLRASGRRLFLFSCPGEPSPEFVDSSVRTLLAEVPGAGPDAFAVVGIGGGSAMDSGKAVAAMLPVAAAAVAGGTPVPSVAEFLEGVGSRAPTGETCFYVAVPTTAGTGSEATKNAVISRIGPDGFKKSLRHDAYAPAVAVVDPELALGCPLPVSAASGLDAFTQLLESYLSPAASPMTDALCESGMERFAEAFPALLDDPSDLGARSGMAYAAYLSGVGLANAGLGSVHGLASPVGGRFPIPHGVVCGRLLLPAVRLNAAALAAAGGAGKAGLEKYASAGFLLARTEAGTGTDRVERGLALLQGTLERLVARAGLPRFSSFGMGEGDVESLAAKAAAKTNPVPLGKEDYARLLREAL